MELIKWCKHMKINSLFVMMAAAFVAVACERGDKDVVPNNKPDTPEQPEEPDTPDEPTDGVVLEAAYFGGEYYGDYYSPGVGNYFIHFSDKGFSDAGYALPEAVYYTLDLYGDYYGGEEVDRLPLPEGTYRLDMENSFTNGTFSVAYSKFTRSDADGQFVEEHQFEAGELVVTATQAVLKVTIAGVEHTVTFDGKADVADKRSATGEDVGGGDDDSGDVEVPEDELSTLTEDYEVDLSDHMLIYCAYGDYYATGINNYTFAIWPNEYVGDFIQFDVMTSATDDALFSGVFDCGDETSEYSFLRGYIAVEGDSGYMNGSWYYKDDGVTMAPFVGGELEVECRADGTASVEFAVLDDKGNTISGSWSGPMTEI